MKKSIIIGLLLICGIIFSSAIFAEANIDPSNNNGTLIINGESKTISNSKYYTNQSNENTIIIMNGGKLIGKSLNIIKEGSSESSNTNNINNQDSNPENKDKDNNTQAPPEKPGEDSTNSGNPPEKPGEDSANSGNPPEKTGEILENNSGTEPENNQEIGSEDSEFYGINAAVLTLYNSNTTISDSEITTNGNGANAVFATNNDSSHSGATINIKDVEIQTYQDKSRGLDATYGGIINAENVKINTRGGSCAAVATDRGEGIVNVINSELNTGVDGGTGKGSPCIYSTGNITVNDSKGTAQNAQIACIEGKNSANIVNSEFRCSAKGNRESNGEYVDLGGIFIYQSMSGDADNGTAVFNGKDSTLSISSDSEYYKTAPMFHVTNTACNISLDNTILEFGSNILLNISSQDQWGESGSNGGDVEFKANNENLKGNIIVDNISSLKFNLKKSQLEGGINPQNNSGNTNIFIESDSTWTLTANSHLTNLTNKGTINYGNYTLYVNGKAYNASNPYKG